MKKTITTMILFLLCTIIVHASYDVTTWPTTNVDIHSGFGPRMNHGIYDLHLGFDNPGIVGEKIYSIAEGQVYKTYSASDTSSSYYNTGNVVVIKHTMDTAMTFHGQKFTTYYSVYGHLNSIGVLAGQKVSKGAVIGTLGQTGPGASYPHLHFETRIGSQCSKEYQTAYPTSSCAKVFTTPQDPHINPLVFLSYTDDSSMAVTVVSESPLTIEVTANTFDINEIIVDGYEIDFNDRQGLDPNDNDNPSYNGVTITPIQMDPFKIQLTYSQNSYSTIEVKDIVGNSVVLYK
ncbi:MAG: M23 family metallopeptidase [Candidatus Woesearchaeota archaeon]|jgi:murein DD-endopeptidase MepM/ murein hydrolase activator NlpD